MQLYFPIVLFVLFVTTTGARADDFVCQFTRYCVATKPCVTHEDPMTLRLDHSIAGYKVMFEGRALSESMFRVIGEPEDGGPENGNASAGLFLIGDQIWADAQERWLLSIRADGAAMMTIHNTFAFGEIQTRTGSCQELE